MSKNRDEFNIICNETIKVSKLSKLINVNLLEMTQEDKNLNLNEANELANLFHYKVFYTKENAEKNFENFTKILGSEKRFPIVSIMGHVNHGKTSLIDSIRQSSITKTEKGGITQNMSLYKIINDKCNFILIDTPGHESFGFMRKLALKISDIIVIVVAADDSVQKQTQEIIKLCKDKPKIICINKIDRNKNVEKVYVDLARNELLSVNFSGDIPTVLTSAVKNIGIDNLLDNINNLSNTLELTTETNRDGIGLVIDCCLDQNLGYICRVILLAGTIKIRDNFIYNATNSKVKILKVDNKNASEASVNDIIDIVGFKDDIVLGEMFVIVSNNTLFDLFKNKPLLNYNPNLLIEEIIPTTDKIFICKTDNLSKIDILKTAIKKYGQVISCSLGNVSISEINFLKEKKDIIFIFWKENFSKDIELLKQNEIKYIAHEVLYQICDEIELLIKQEISVKEKKEVGKGKIIEIFNFKKFTIAGTKVIDGKVSLGNECKIFRNETLIYTGKISSIHREKDAIKEGLLGTECGLLIKITDQIEPIYEKGDLITFYE